MNILVYDVAASSHGVLSILHDFYESVTEYPDKSIQWFFVIGKTDLEETENIHVIKMDWAKKSWLHRLCCDCFTMPKFVKKNRIDKIFSLQNIVIPFVKVNQDVYLHQPIPYVDYVFHFWKKEERVLWIQQHLIGKVINRSLRQAGNIFVQTDWVSRSAGRIAGVPSNKFTCVQPDIDNGIVKKFDTASIENDVHFFFPATPFVYKNHKVILQAAKLLKEQGTEVFCVDLTVNDVSQMSESCRKLLPQVEERVKLIGTLPREQVMERYTRSVLLFPSVVETFGLPLLEARVTGSPILASDMPFSHDILDDYENVQFFDPDSPDELARLMKQFISHTYRYCPVKDASRAQQNNWKVVLDKVVTLKKPIC